MRYDQDNSPVEFIEVSEPVKEQPVEEQIVYPRPGPSWVPYWAVLGVFAAGGVGAVVSTFLPELTLHYTARATYSINGWGAFQRVGPADPNYSLSGRGPALGAVALGAGLVIVLLATIAMTSVGQKWASSALHACAGVVVGSFACVIVTSYALPRPMWASGLWLLAASTVTLIIGSVLLAFRPRSEPFHSTADLAS